MVKSSKNSSLGGARVKVRVIEFEMDGSDESIQESMQTLTAALSRGVNPVSRQISHATRSQESAASSPDLESSGEVEEDIDIADAEPRMQRERRPSSPRKPPVVKVLDGINFTDVSPTLKEFYEKKNPQSDLAKYLVVAYWYKNTRGIPDLTVDHFHTAFRALKIATPRNPLQPIRDLRAARNGKMAGGETSGTHTIHHLGETFVEELNKGT
jgi:hypothetical protein